MKSENYHHALPDGYVLLEYRIDHVLGAGGFGITYKALDTQLNKYVAIKEYLPSDFALRLEGQTVAPKSDGDTKDFKWGLGRFLDEAQTLARFDHPNLNRVYRFFEANGTAYLVLEYIDGRTLSELLKSESILPAGILLRMIDDLLSGLEEIHQEYFVHRDIKPGNIMLRKDGRAVLLDFGAARQAVGGLTKSLTSILTPGYAPIEQYDSKAEDIGPWTDLYALGMVAYRAVSGMTDSQLPDAVTRSRFHSKGHAGKDLEPAAEAAKGKYPRTLLKAIDWAICVNEEDRPQSIKKWRQTLPGNDKATVVSRPPEPVNEHRQDDQRRGSKLSIQSQSNEKVKPAGTRWPVYLILIVVMVAVAGYLFQKGDDQIDQPVSSITSTISAVTGTYKNKSNDAHYVDKESLQSPEKSMADWQWVGDYSYSDTAGELLDLYGDGWIYVLKINKSNGKMTAKLNAFRRQGPGQDLLYLDVVQSGNKLDLIFKQTWNSTRVLSIESAEFQKGERLFQLDMTEKGEAGSLLTHVYAQVYGKSEEGNDPVRSGVYFVKEVRPKRKSDAWPDGEKYVGEYKNGKRNGQGTSTFPDGKKYVGEHKEDHFNGQGTYTWSDGRKYVGEFKDSKRNGKGTLTLPDGRKYVGEYKNDKINGHGTYTWPDGREYVGEFIDSKRNGQGTYRWPSGQKYIGEHKDGHFNGQGTYTWPDGRKYVGKFIDDKINGQGTYTWPDGSNYVGEFKDGKRNGQGKSIDTNGKVTEERWENGKRVEVF